MYSEVNAILMNESVLILDDHPIIRVSICSFLTAEFPNLLITQIDTVSNIFKILKSNTFTHLILDLKLKDGSAIDVLPTIRDFYPTLHILVLSSLPRDIYYPALAKYNLFDYLEKSTDFKDIKIVLSDFILNNTKNKPKEVLTENPFSKLSIKEFEVLNYLVSGNSLKNISVLLNVHINTISTYKTRILEKTNTQNMKSLIDLCTLWGIE